MVAGSIPTSSCVSRRAAAASEASDGSRLPPGKEMSPGWRAQGVRPLGEHDVLAAALGAGPNRIITLERRPPSGGGANVSK